VQQFSMLGVYYELADWGREFGHPPLSGGAIASKKLNLKIMVLLNVECFGFVFCPFLQPR
jgi:hypothetical protein